jgi:transketolase
MVSSSLRIAKELDLSCVSVPQLKPFGERLPQILSRFPLVVVIEEHSRYGGLAALVLGALCLGDSLPHNRPRIYSLALEDKFPKHCGSYKYALSEHGLSDEQLLSRVRALLPRI